MCRKCLHVRRILPSIYDVLKRQLKCTSRYLPYIDKYDAYRTSMCWKQIVQTALSSEIVLMLLFLSLTYLTDLFCFSFISFRFVLFNLTGRPVRTFMTMFSDIIQNCPTIIINSYLASTILMECFEKLEKLSIKGLVFTGLASQFRQMESAL